MPSPDPEWLWDLIDIFAKRVELAEPRISRLSESGKVLSVFSGFARVEELGECLLVRHLLSPVSFPLMTESRRRCALAFCELPLLPSFLSSASLSSFLLSSLGGLGVTGLFRVYM